MTDKFYIVETDSGFLPQDESYSYTQNIEDAERFTPDVAKAITKHMRGETQNIYKLENNTIESVCRDEISN